MQKKQQFKPSNRSLSLMCVIYFFIFLFYLFIYLLYVLYLFIIVCLFLYLLGGGGLHTYLHNMSTPLYYTPVRYSMNVSVYQRWLHHNMPGCYWET